MVGQNLGAERPDIAETSTYQALLMSCSLVGTMGIAFLLFPASLIRFYTSDPEVARLGAIYLRIMDSCQIHQAFGFVFLGALRGAGDARFVMYVTAFSAWALRLGHPLPAHRRDEGRRRGRLVGDGHRRPVQRACGVAVVPGREMEKSRGLKSAITSTRQRPLLARCN